MERNTCMNLETSLMQTEAVTFKSHFLQTIPEQNILRYAVSIIAPEIDAVV